MDYVLRNDLQQISLNGERTGNFLQQKNGNILKI